MPTPLIRLSLSLRYAVAVLAVGVAVLLALFLTAGLKPTLPGQISSPLLLLAVAISAWCGGIGPGFFAAALSLLGLEYLFLPPELTLHISLTDMPRLLAFLGASILVGRLTAKRQQAETALSRTEAKLRTARMIQQRLLPSHPPVLPGFDVAGVSFPVNTVGGDYFDYIPMRNGTMGIVLGDVSGHGIGPALLMAEIRAYLRALASTHDDIGEILTITNRVLTQDTGEEFVTLFFASVDPRTGKLTYAGAGHEAHLLEPHGEVRRLESTSLPLGVTRDLVVPCAPTIELVPDQVLLLLTDGVYETPSLQEGPLGIQRTLEVACANRTRSAQGIIDSLHAELVSFARGHPQEDDITILTLKHQTTTKHSRGRAVP